MFHRGLRLKGRCASDVAVALRVRCGVLSPPPPAYEARGTADGKADDSGHKDVRQRPWERREERQHNGGDRRDRPEEITFTSPQRDHERVVLRATPERD